MSSQELGTEPSEKIKIPTCYCPGRLTKHHKRLPTQEFCRGKLRCWTHHPCSPDACVGRSIDCDEFDMGPGGKGTNQSVAAARLGAHVGLLACIGGDIFSTVSDKLLDEEGIARDHIHRIPDINTAVCFVHLIPSGDNWIVGHWGANLHIRTEHVDAAEEQIASSNIVIAQYEVPDFVVRRALELGRKHGRLTIWNPTPAQPTRCGPRTASFVRCARNNRRSPTGRRRWRGFRGCGGSASCRARSRSQPQGSPID